MVSLHGLRCGRRANNACSDDQGSLGPMLVVLVVAALALAGLVVDGGRILSGKRLAHDAASQAAQIASQEVDENALRSGQSTPRLDPGLASAAASAYLSAAGVTGSVTVAGDEVIVTTEVAVSMQMLGPFGVGPKKIVGQASARAVRGVHHAET